METLTQSVESPAPRDISNEVVLEFEAVDSEALGRFLLRCGGGDISVRTKNRGSLCVGRITLHDPSEERIQELTQVDGVMVFKMTVSQDAPPVAATNRSSLQLEVQELRKTVDELTRMHTQLAANQEALSRLLRYSLKAVACGAHDPSLPDAQEAPADDPFDPPLVTGNVIEVHEDPFSASQLTLNRGSSHGLQPGMRLEVYSRGTYKGRIEVTRVESDFALGELVQEVDGTKIKAGDSVTTRL